MPEVNLENDKKSESEKRRVLEAQKELTLQVSEKWPKRLWKQLKSPKVWVPVVVAVLAPLVVFLYAEYQTDKKNQEENALTAKQLKIEIVGRLTHFLVRLDDIRRNGDVHDLAKLMKEIGSVKDNASPMNFISKFADANLTSLLLMLKSVSVPNCFGEIILDNATLSAIKIQVMVSIDILGSTPESEFDTLIDEVEGEIKTVFLVTSLDEENELSPPSDISQEELDYINSVKRDACS